MTLRRSDGDKGKREESKRHCPHCYRLLPLAVGRQNCAEVSLRYSVYLLREHKSERGKKGGKKEIATR